MENSNKLIYLISTAQHLMKLHLKKQFTVKEIDLSPSHTTLLFLIEKNGPMSMNQLSENMFIENSTVTGLIDRLEKKGFVKRVPVPGDRRRWNIDITSLGVKEMEKGRAVIHQVNDQIAEGFTPAEVDQMKAILLSFFEKFKQ